MKVCLKVIVFFAFICFSATQVFALQTNNKKLSCQKNNIPSVIKPIDNYDIIATNVGVIQASRAFSGSQLTYSISSHPTNKKNNVKINSATGEISVNAEKKDQFNITVKAKNICGSASTTFNVEIDEEE